MSKRDEGIPVSPLYGYVTSLNLTPRQWYKGMCAAGLLARGNVSDVHRDAAEYADLLIAEDQEAYRET